MKKTLTALAVMAIAASAYAELASWGSLGAANGTAVGDYKYLDDSPIGVTDMTAYNGASLNTSSGQGNSYDIRLGSLSANEGAGLTFGFSVLEDTLIQDATITAGTHATASGPEQMDWFLGDSEGPQGTAVASIISTGTAPATNVSWNLGMLSGNGNVYLVANTAAGRPGTATGGITGNFDLGFGSASPIVLNGTVVQESAVPEPATMSLLGLGALAVALRRKLRK